MKMPQDHIERIAALGYTESEARFLYLVATHSGYFTLRHFNDFAGVHRGKRSMALAQKLLKHAHATMRDYMGAGSVFHLFSRLIYGPIEKDHLRNHRRHSFDYIRTRLVQLDFLLENPGFEFLETESDKINLFCESLAVPKDVLPARVYEGTARGNPTVRYFVDKFPLFLAPPVSGASPVVTFGFVDSGPGRLLSFVAYLAAYQSLFRHLKSFRLLYIAPRTTEFRRAEERFRLSVKPPLEADPSGEVLRYFEIRRKWEKHEYVVPVTADFEFLNEARRLFHGERFETLYQAWIAGRIAEQELRQEFKPSTPEQTIFFNTYLVRNRRSPLDEKHRLGVNGSCSER
ncbi:MAG: hypothetical protein ABSG69_19855 [Candidatus Acidiferrum sp.]|jgi:hypothetical protein